MTSREKVLLRESEVCQSGFVIPPALTDLDVEFQIHFQTKQRFQLVTSGSSNLFQQKPPFANHDGFLRIPFDKYRRVYAIDFFGFLKSINHNGSGIWQFVVRQDDQLLSNDLGGHRPLLLVAELVL